MLGAPGAAAGAGRRRPGRAALASCRCSARRSARRCWRRGTRRRPRIRADRCIHELFEAQAARTPEAVAVRFEERVADLRRAGRARQPARAPPARARRGPRGARGRAAWSARLELVVALLAVLKAGGAYVPLDPAYPPSGWRSCWPTAPCRVLLTQAAAARRRSPRATASRCWPGRAAERLAAEPADEPGGRRGRRTPWPTSSTPPARPAGPRA